MRFRVTIAASGQGRFAEELEFAADCQASGFNPVLLVLDPTPSSRLQDLAQEYKRVGGRAFIGDAAWKHLEDQSGPTMATFVEKYVRKPIAAVDHHAANLLDLSISSDNDAKAFTIRVGATQWSVARREIAELGAEETSEE